MGHDIEAIDAIDAIEATRFAWFRDQRNGILFFKTSKLPFLVSCIACKPLCIMAGRRASLKACEHCTSVGSPPSVSVVTTHYLEPLDWVAPAVALHERLRVFIYECGVSPLPRGVKSHPRVILRDKSGPLATRDPFFSFFDHVVGTYEELADYTLFMHGHDTHYHRQTPTNRVIQLAFDLVDSRQVDYVNLGDAVHSTWAGCASFGAIQSAAPAEPGPPSRCLVAPPCASMTALVNSSWDLLAGVLGGRGAPAEITEINGNEALVSRCRLLGRQMRFWERLRDLTKAHHSLLAYGLEGSFHRIMGEPWVRPFLLEHAAHLNFVACGDNAQDTLWPGRFRRDAGAPAFEVRWQDHSELALRAALPVVGSGSMCS